MRRILFFDGHTAMWSGTAHRHGPGCLPCTSCRTGHRSDSRLLTSLSRTTPTAVSEHESELIGYPTSTSFTTSCVCIELRPLPSTGITRLPRYYEPLRHPRAPDPSTADDINAFREQRQLYTVVVLIASLKSKDAFGIRAIHPRHECRGLSRKALVKMAKVGALQADRCGRPFLFLGAGLPVLRKGARPCRFREQRSAPARWPALPAQPTMEPH
jgi:hypothetical protein